MRAMIFLGALDIDYAVPHFDPNTDDPTICLHFTKKTKIKREKEMKRIQRREILGENKLE